MKIGIEQDELVIRFSRTELAELGVKYPRFEAVEVEPGLVRDLLGGRVELDFDAWEIPLNVVLTKVGPRTSQIKLFPAQ